MIDSRKLNRESLRDTSVVTQACETFSEEISHLSSFIFYALIKRIENNEKISYLDSFLGFLSVVGANNPVVRKILFPDITLELLEKRAVIFLMSMRFREERGIICGEEIAGMIAATRFDFTYLFHSDTPITEMCGMGGDIGFGVTDFSDSYRSLSIKIQAGFEQEVSLKNEEKYYEFLMQDIIIPDRAIKQSYKSKNKKTVNISTLSSLLLASLGYPSMKHGSGKNTTSVGSTEAIVHLGVPIIHKSREAARQALDINGFVYTDAIISKTIHDISGNILKTETVNHLIGPMTPPIDAKTPLNKVLGINHNISPDILGKAYEVLHEKGVYTIGDVLIVGGFGPESVGVIDKKSLSHTNIRLDEFSPYGTHVGVIIQGKYQGIVYIDASDFGARIDMESTLLAGSEGLIQEANTAVSQGRGSKEILSLVACNAALGILVSSGLLQKKDTLFDGKINPKYLRICYERAYTALIQKKISSFTNSLLTPL